MNTVILCGDHNEVERLALRDFSAICPPANASTPTLSQYRGSLVVVTPNGRRERAGVTHVLRALGCDVRTLAPDFAVDTDDPLTSPSEPLFVRANGVNADAHDSLCPLSVKELIQRSSPRWLVRGVLAERSLAVIFGAPGSGKTFLALDMAASIARGEHWMGQRVRQCGVIYCAAEGHLGVRLMAYLEHRQLPADDLSRLRVVASRINLLALESGDLDTLVFEINEAATEMGEVALVVLDTLNSMMPGGNENASEDMGAMIASARRIMEAINCAVVFVHHSGKNESKGSRGHSSLIAACDVEIQITGQDVRVAELVKVRDGEQGQRFPFRLQSVDLGRDLDPDAEPEERQSSCVVVPSDSLPVKLRSGKRLSVDETNALDALRSVVREYVIQLPLTSAIPPGVQAATMEQWRDKYYQTDQIDVEGDDAAVMRREQGARKKRFQRARNGLRAAGKIGNAGAFWWIN